MVNVGRMEDYDGEYEEKILAVIREWSMLTLVCKKDTAEQAEQSRAFDKKLYRVRQANWFNCVEQ